MADSDHNGTGSGTGDDNGNGSGAQAAPQMRQDSIDENNVFDDAKTYYNESRHKANKATARTRTFSQVCSSTGTITSIRTAAVIGPYWTGHSCSHSIQNSLLQQMERLGLKEPFRRGSHGMSAVFAT